MRVLLAIGSLGGGGAERVMTWLADHLVNAGDSVCLLTRYNAPPDFYRLNPAVRRVTFDDRRYFRSCTASLPFNFWRWVRVLRAAARRERPDVVLSFTERTNLSVLAAFAGSGIPVVAAIRVDPRHADLNAVEQRLRPHLYRYLARRVVFQTEAVAARTQGEWGLRSVAVVPNAVLLVSNRDVPDPTSRAPRVLAVGRLTVQKGHDLLVDAWARLAARFPGWQLRIVGEGPLRSALEDRAARLGVASSVSLPGLVEDVATEYCAASIFVLPSRYEGFPNALLEAMACGCATIATTDAGASVEVIQPTVNGELIPGDNIEALVTALATLMDDRDRRTNYGAQATAVASRYAPDQVFGMWRRVLTEAAGLS